MRDVNREDARALIRALDEHYAEHPEVRPTLAEVAQTAAEMDGNPLASRPDLLRDAAAEVVADNPDADCDDVLTYAEKMTHVPPNDRKLRGSTHAALGRLLAEWHATLGPVPDDLAAAAAAAFDELDDATGPQPPPT